MRLCTWFAWSQDLDDQQLNKDQGRARHCLNEKNLNTIKTKNVACKGQKCCATDVFLMKKYKLKYTQNRMRNTEIKEKKYSGNI